MTAAFPGDEARADAAVCPFCRSVINGRPLFGWWWHFGGSPDGQSPSCCAVDQHTRRQQRAARTSGPIPIMTGDSTPSIAPGRGQAAPGRPPAAPGRPPAAPGRPPPGRIAH